MKIDLSQFRDAFLDESAEHIAGIESGLLRLKQTGADDETLNSIFRAAHSIKGGAGTFGLTNVVTFTHALENLFDQMRDHKIGISADLVSLLLRANDVLKELIQSHDDTAPEGLADVQKALEVACSSSGTMLSGGHTPQAGPSDITSGENHYLISFQPAADIFSFGTDPLLLLRNLAALGRFASTSVDLVDVPDLVHLKSDQCFLAWSAELVTSAPKAEVDEIFDFVLDCAIVEVRLKDEASVSAKAKIGQHRPQSLQAIQKPIPAKAAPAKAENSSVRVPTEKIDKLIDLIGEMVIAHSITSRLVENVTPESLSTLQESIVALERHIRELHERTMSVRMLPIGSLFGRFQRLIHDLADKTGKQLRLITEGDETEVDRGVLELIGDPLTHVFRNSADHGIELPADRIKAGKDPEGTLVLRASHVAGHILIEMIDDGAGLNLARIREKAVSKGLVAPDAELTTEQIRMLIFEPGFSTKEQVSDLSGRGVGMDVVRKNVAALNGSISLDSQEGIGTHIKIQLPLTLAILEGLIFRVGSQNFVISLVSILETVCLDPTQIHDVAGRGEVAIVREEAIPLLRLRRLFGLEQPEADEDEVSDPRALVVVIEHDNQRSALEIDELLGQQQVVVKSLERNFQKLDGTLGATILGDGKPALILDAQALIAGRAKSPNSHNGKRRMSLVA